MSKVRKYVFYSNWDRQNLICACLFHNPCCDKYKKCEEIELELRPYDDVESCMRSRRYKRNSRGCIEQY